MTRDEHEAKFREIRSVVRKHGYRWLASPIHQDFLTGDRNSCAPGDPSLATRTGGRALYLVTDGIFPTYEALLEHIEWDSYGPGHDPRCEHCGILSGFEPSAGVRRPEASRRPSGAWRGR